MKFMFFLFLLNAQIFSQAYFDLYYGNGDPMSSTPLSSISKITFLGTDATFHLNDNSTITKEISIFKYGKFSTNGGGELLPVELLSFIALVDGDEIVLKWVTATEINNYGFEIERSILYDNWETTNFVKIGFIEGCGNSNLQKDYLFTDNSVQCGKIQYRLKQIDTDGNFRYSQIITLEIWNTTGLQTTKFSLEQNYPNPFNPKTIIKYSLPKSGFVKINVYDILGNEIAALTNEVKEAGTYNVTFDGSFLSSGIYICRINCLNFNKSIKMMLIK